MGTWGLKNFENDGAADFVYDFYEHGNKMISKAFDKIINPEDKYLDAGDCEEALAGAEIIAAAKGKPSEDLPHEMKDWLSKNDALNFKKNIFSKKIDLTEKAQICIHKILKFSELKELWEETDEFNDWLELQNNLLNRIK